ncbi:MAG: glycosyl transferase, partial [Planctomycetota bacterium]
MKFSKKIHEKPSQKPGVACFLCLFIICLIAHVILASVGWNNTLCGWHGFRQTQTAITSYYTIKEGFKLNYVTPVLGKPWSIPMEFPLFQWIVAVVVLITGINLDQAGRLVSLIFFYLSLIPIYHLLAYLVTNKSHRLLFLCLILASPYYIFWSRCFMIESLALFLGLVFLVLFVRSLLKPSLLTLAAASIAGALAALTKITTLVVFLLPAFFFFIWCCLPKNRRLADAPVTLMKRTIYSCVIVGFMLIISLAWTKFADNQKLLNPMAVDFITS